jgi:hypothetical protein
MWPLKEVMGKTRKLHGEKATVKQKMIKSQLQICVTAEMLMLIETGRNQSTAYSLVRVVNL